LVAALRNSQRLAAGRTTPAWVKSRPAMQNHVGVALCFERRCQS